MVELINTSVYAGRLKDSIDLKNSSSGGAFTALSDYFLDNGGAVVASIYNYDNHDVEFQLILRKQERNMARGSKYIQSKPGDIFCKAYKWIMENPEKKLLFIGMGCQADAFRKFVEIKKIRNRVCIVDIVCHGSPSPRIWKEYIRTVEKKNNGKITYLSFKDKRNGWRFPVAFVKINDQEIFIKDYVKIFYNNCALRPSCHQCAYAAIQRKTDITIGDFWNIETTIPDFYSSQGNSLFIIHTNIGKELFDNIKDKLDYKLSDTEQCWQMNLEKPTEISKYREKFWKDYEKKGIEYIMKKYGKVSFKTKLRNKFSKLLSRGGQNEVDIVQIANLYKRGLALS